MSGNDPSAQTVPTRTRWQRFRLLVKVIELRLRFVALMAATGLTFAYWDTLWNRYDHWMRPASTHSLVHSEFEYYCPMHPNVVRDEPGSCPICGMPLSKRKRGEKQALPEGVIGRVQLAPLRVSQAGIATSAVEDAPLSETLTTVGFVEFDERLEAHIASKVRGMARVETLHVNFNGEDVAEGQTLAELYSPELYQAIQELLLARRSAREAPRPQSVVGRALLGDPKELSRLAVEKLKLWGITQAQVDEILAKGRADYKVPIVSPLSGHVIKKNVVQGQYISEGQPMFEVVGLETVWIKARVYEDRIGLVHLGQEVEAEVEAFPGRTFRGRVAFIQPHLDPETRTVEVRYDLDNPGHQLRPGMYASVTLKTLVSATPMFQARQTGKNAGGAVFRKLNLTIQEQKTCPVTHAELGTMGPPVAAAVEGGSVWTCCDACPPRLKVSPARYIGVSTAAAPAEADDSSDVKPPTVCPVTGAKLGSMGPPVSVSVQGRSVQTCCAACPPKLKKEPARYLARLEGSRRGEVLSVPESAVIDTGILRMVYVEAEPGVYEGRRVVLGPRSGDRYPVLEGLARGERVVTRGAFLVDAESRLNPPTTPPASATSSIPESNAPPAAAMPGHHHG